MLLTGCAAGSAQPGTSDAARSSSRAASAPKTLTVGLEAEPTDAFVGSIAGGSGTVAGNLKLAVHQALVHYDDRGGLHPMLAAEVPAQANGTWVVNPDGTMQTTYRLRPNITWHDGTPLTSR